MKRARAGIDLDGCVYAWEPHVRAMLARRFGIHLEESQHYDSIELTLKQQGISDVWKWLWTEGLDEMFRDGNAYPEAIPALLRLADSHDLIFVTRRRRQAAPATLEWLSKQGLPIAEVRVLDGSGYRKSEARCAWYVDDSPQELEHLVQDLAPRVFVMNRPWNQNLSVAYETVRVRSWSELLGKVTK